MSTLRLPFHRRLVGRITLFGLVPVVAIMGLIVATNAVRAYAYFERGTVRELQDATRLAASQVDRENAKVATLAATIGRAQTDGGMFGRRAETLAYLRAILADHADIQGTYVLYEPNADGNDKASRAALPKEALDANGRFVPYFRRDAARPDGIRLEPNVGMEDFPRYLYYVGPRQQWENTGRAEVLFTKPYDYEGVAIMEHTFPLVRDGTFVGIAGVDRSLAEISRMLGTIASRLEGDCFLVTKSLDGVERYISATPDGRADPSGRLQTREVRGTPLEAIFAKAPSERGAVVITSGDDPVLGERCRYAIARLDFGGWTLVTRKPERVLESGLVSLVATNSATALAGIAIIALILLLLARGVGRRIQAATAVAERIASGDLTQKLVTGEVKDESGVLLNAFASMASNLVRIAQQMRRASIQINSTSTELGASAVQQEQVAGGLSASATQVSAATQEISATGTELLRTLDDLGASAEGAGAQADSGRTSVRGMQEALHRLDEAARSVTTKLSAINDKSQGITTIVATITRVAEQTNLLSVNAALEAERAGDLGLGFLVVAREIRRLADQTAEATLDIDRVIRQMQSAVAGGMMEMGRFGDSLQSCVHEGETLGHRLEDIVSHVDGDTDRVKQIIQGMRTQSTGVQQIDEAMRSLAASARQSRAVASDFSKASSGLQSAIDTLKTAVSSFRLQD